MFSMSVDVVVLGRPPSFATLSTLMLSTAARPVSTFSTLVATLSAPLAARVLGRAFIVSDPPCGPRRVDAGASDD